MKFVSNSSEKYGPYMALDEDQIKKIFKIAKLKQSDVFYDLGSGNGEIVRQAITLHNVKKAVGIEEDYLRFLGSVIDTTSLMTKKEQSRIEFIREDFEKNNFSEATVVYHGLSETKKTVSMFNTVFEHKRSVRIIVPDIPFVGYRPIKINKTDYNNPFVVMQTPLEEYRVDKNQWIKEVLGKKGTIEDVYRYRSKLLTELDPKDKKSFMTDLKNLVKIRF
ncbi:MAG: hypothetical protein AABZ36_05510 [Nitrospirota bacterium]